MTGTTVIHPGNPVDHEKYLRRGWGLPEKTACWISDTIARCLFFLAEPDIRKLEITARSLPNLPETQKLNLYVNGTIIGRIALTDSFQSFQFDVRSQIQQSGWNRLDLEPNRLDRPVNLGLGPDNRRLAAFIKEIKFIHGYPVPETPSQKPFFLLKDNENPVLEAGQKLKTTFIAPGEFDLKLLFQGKKESVDNKCKLTICQDPRGYILTETSFGFNKKKELSFHIKASEKPILISVLNTGAGSFQVEGRISKNHSSVDLNPTVSNGDFRKKHLVVIIFDAFHASFLGCYGTPDAYTPFWDRLSLEGHLYSDMYSSASYTVTSVAGILTGLLPPDHGVESVGDSLSEKNLTWAEKLKNKSYYTEAFSAMPTVSGKWSFDRGFNQFHEIFYRYEHPVSGHDFLRILKKEIHFPEDKNTFHYIHFREPHAPYNPPFPFDRLWGPTLAYTGEISFLKKADSHPEQLSDKEKNQIIRRYKGQVAFTDRLLEDTIRMFMNKQSNQKNIRFLVSSDHGEAFGEHNRYEHNSTVYREMIHVPCIVWPHQSATETIIRDPSSNRFIIQIINSKIEKRSKKPGWFVHRSAGNRFYDMGITDGTHHLITTGYYPDIKLYEWETDPEEWKNTYRDNPVLSEYLLIRLEQCRNHTNSATNRRSTLETSMIDKLKALGYLR